MSLFDTVEEISLLAPIEQEVTVPIPFQVVTLWMRSDVATGERGNGRMFIRDPGEDNDRELFSFEVDLTQFVRLRQRVNIGGLRIVRPGVKELIIQLESQPDQWQTVARLPLEIKVQEPKTEPH